MTILKQNDPTWGGKPLNGTKTTLGQAGCLLTTLTTAYNILNGTNLTPVEAMNKILKADSSAFIGADIVVEKAAKALGLLAPEKERVRSLIDSPLLLSALVGAMNQGGLAIVHVDHDSKVQGGDQAGDHFLLCIGYYRPVAPVGLPEVFLCTDSAPGALVALQRVGSSGLIGESRWGNVMKTYRPVSIIPVRPAPPQSSP